MTKFLVSLILIALLGLGAGLYLPFWSLAIVAFGVSALIPQVPWRALLCGFLAAALLWSGLAFFLDRANAHILSTRISQLVLGSSSPMLLITLTGLLGGIIGGMSALSASFLHRRPTPI